MDKQRENILLAKIRGGDKKAFEALFRQYYPHLCLYTTKVLKNPSAAEEIVQELFVLLWENRKKTKIESSLQNYLFRAVKNHCLNYIKHNQIVNEHSKKVLAQTEKFYSGENIDTQQELFQKIEESISELPEKRQKIFRMSREEGLKYNEIALKLNISVKTVETQIGLAISTLRKKLRHFLIF
ncbi:RNA polymerase sigma-70 factor, ECF subfamily [Mariniphaga anaerophila]|uniref:RNA polymerase sigma-70 factor, ECF subfamily n=1 Tax=Mariniphaga anaerophila TaxID=1484053 RepID=A0A1M5EMK3_9BACT|nr:RNA polymerase sigma-70 factor [Mariniphaga anaerophila]SHF80262.1 RNA polymerase sigma-70 factor, ECF subfamily [Mariniphaga anaerophila]